MNIVKNEWRMIIDTEKCVGCHACEVACKQEFDAPLGFFRTVTLYLDSGTYPKVKREFLPLQCRQCHNASCMHACTKGAISVKQGIVLIDEQKCNGCGDCVKACNIGAIYVNPINKIAEKCNLCEHRLNVGMKAACEATCVAEAITIVNMSLPLPPNASKFKMNQNEKTRTLYIGANEKMKQKLKKGRPFSPFNYEINSWAEITK